jgi:hypothetical protein
MTRPTGGWGSRSWLRRWSPGTLSPRCMILSWVVVLVCTLSAAVPTSAASGTAQIQTLPAGSHLPDIKAGSAGGPQAQPLRIPEGSGLVSDGAAGSGWVNVTAGVAAGPTPRSNASAVWDPLGPYLLLFGGEIGSIPLGDTWTFANGVWSQLHLIPSPSPRFGAGITFDTLDSYVVLFGGASSPGPTGVIQANVTWDFQNSQWHHLGTITPPRGRSFPQFAFDPVAGANILFGGLLPTNQSAETWELVGALWTPLTPGGPGEPFDRVAGTMVYDSSPAELLLFGGWDPETPTPLDLNDTWLYSWNSTQPNASTWSPQTPSAEPSPRFDFASSFDTSIGAIVVFGGEGAAGPLNDTWLWTGSDWAPGPGGATAPNPRLGAVLAGSSTPGGPSSPTDVPDLLLGGILAPGVLASDVWFFGVVPLAILPPIISPTASDVGHLVALSVFAFGGGSSSYSYTWRSLPPGCGAVNAASFTCTPTAAANTPYEISVTLRNASGVTVTSASSPWSVNSLPSLTLFTALQSPLPAGSTLNITVLFSGGTGPFSFQYFGLPAGCASMDAQQFNCTPNAPGNYSLRVVITDADGQTTTGATALVVGDPLPAASPLWEYVVEGILIAIGVVVVLNVSRHKLRQKSRPPKPPPPAGLVRPGTSVSPPKSSKIHVEPAAPSGPALPPKGGSI